MSQWTPNVESLLVLKTIFEGILTNVNQEQNFQALQHAREQPEFENYLIYLLVLDRSARTDVRAAAGTNLKNCILKSKRSYGQKLYQRVFVLEHILDGLYDPDKLIRNITGNVITSLFSLYGIEGWPQALPKLLEMADASQQQSNGHSHEQSHHHSHSPNGQPSKNSHTHEAAISALAKICEDSVVYLDHEYNGERPLNFMIVKFLYLTKNPSSSTKVKALAIHCINQFIPLKTQSFLVHLDDFLQTLFTLANSQDATICKNICVSFCNILETRPDKLMPHLDGVIDYCVHLMTNAASHEEVSLQACEFLLTLASIADSNHYTTIIQPKLPALLPILLQNMVYSHDEIATIQMIDERDDATVEDREEDIRPQNAKAKETHKLGKKSSKNGRTANGSNRLGYDSDDDDGDDGDDDEDEDSDYEDDDDMELEQWSLRKCSASTLDVLSISLPSAVLEVTLPILQERIVSNEWTVREAAILAFGAISAGCIELCRDKLPSLVPFLVDRLQDQETRVRLITCWTLSRYASWVCEEAFEGGQYASYFQPTFQSIITCVLDNKKVVQESACSALTSFIEEASTNLFQSYNGLLMEQYSKCLQTYQKKNLHVLYDSIVTFVDKIGYKGISANQEAMNVLLPQLFHKWEVSGDEDEALWPLFKCMASIAAAMKELFLPYALPVFQRAIKILANTIDLDQRSQVDPMIEAPDKDFIVASLDLIDGLVQGFEFDSSELLGHNNFNLMQWVLQCLEDTSCDVRQSAYALIGDLAIYALDSVLKPDIQLIIISIGNEIHNKSFGAYPVYNNAIWALGEIIMRLPIEEAKPYMNNLVNLLIPVLNSTDSQQVVLENAVICIGRMGLNGGAELIAPRLPEFIVSWCSHMLYLEETEEKENGFQGMINILQANPDHGLGGLSTQQGKSNLSIILVCIGNYQEPAEHLKALFHQLMISYKGVLGDDVWNTQIMGNLDGNLRQHLQTVYGV